MLMNPWPQSDSDILRIPTPAPAPFPQIVDRGTGTDHIYLHSPSRDRVDFRTSETREGEANEDAHLHEGQRGRILYPCNSKNDVLQRVRMHTAGKESDRPIRMAFRERWSLDALVHRVIIHRSLRVTRPS